MRLVSTINPKLKLGFILLFISSSVLAQQNSPFSRYGLGDLSPSQNIVNRGMAGVAVSYADGQSVNFYNPATYSSHKVVTFDVGVTIDSRTLRSENPIKKYNTTNFTPAYVAVGMPLNRKRNLGLAFGLRPLSNINYMIEQRKRLPGIDSVANIFEGEGGLYQLYTGVGKKWGGFSVGLNVGYNFGRRQLNTRTLFLNDTVEYAQTNVASTTTYGKAFINGGMQYQFQAGKNSFVRLGASARFKQTFNAEQDLQKETFQYNATGVGTRIDSVFESTGRQGSIEIPATYTAGIMLQNTIVDKLGNRMDRTMFGIEYETSKWSEFRFYGAPDQVADAWQLRIGAQITPDPLSITSYWNRVNYRFGFYTGRDFANPDGKELSIYGLTFGAGLPIRKWRSFDNQFTVINTAFEVGKRGNKNNNITESFFRLSFGLSLSDIWFIKRRYD